VRAWIMAAWQKVERDTGVVLLTSTWRFMVEEYPVWNQALHLPLYPIQSVDLFQYYDSQGVLQDVMTGSPPALPYLIDYGRPVRLGLPDAGLWPSDLRTFQPGIVEVTAGWTDPEFIPDDLKQAMKLLIGQSALFREQDVAGQGMTVMKVSVDYDRWIERWLVPGV
jgi:uncharacterized phiE125 gp8 family phage protein